MKPVNFSIPAHADSPPTFYRKSFYHKDTGFFHDSRLMTSVFEHVALNTPADHIAIDGHHDHLSKRVDLATGEIVEYQPPQPSNHHVWNDTTKRWQLSEERQTALSNHQIALMRIEALEAVQLRHLRNDRLGLDPKAIDKLREVNDEIIEVQKSVLQELL